MPTIILNRSNEYINRFRNYEVYLDGIKIGTIANGETKEFDLFAGQHSVVTKIDWTSSNTLMFEISDTEIKTFKVEGFKNARWLMPSLLVIIVLNLLANLLFDFHYLFYLLIPGFLIMLYYMTIGRKRYLTLTER